MASVDVYSIAKIVSEMSKYVAKADLTVTPGASVSGSNTGDQTLPTWTTLSGKPAVVAAGADAAAARTAIGAGTSNLALGTTSSTAKAGNYTPPAASATAQGIVELATTAETTTGTDTTRAVTPAGVKAVVDTKAPLSGQFAVNTVASSGATSTLPATHAAHKVTMNQNCTLSFASPTAGHAFVLLLLGAFIPTWPASVDWAGGTAPTYASGTLYHFATLDGGTTWLGSGQAYS